MAEPVTSRLQREIFFRTFASATRPSEAVVQQFVESLIEMQVPRGAVLFRAGDPSDYIHYIVSGQIRLDDPSGRTAPWSFGGRSAIGAIDAIQDQPYSRTAVAVEDVLLFRIRFEDYLEILEDNFEFAKAGVGFIYGRAEELSRGLPGDFVYPDQRSPDLPIRRPLGRLGLVERVQVLRASRPFRQIRLQVLVSLAQAAAERRLGAGQTLYELGEDTSALWFVVSGSVVGERAVPALAARFAPGTMVLPLAALAQREAGYRAVAAEPSLVLALGKEDLWDVMEDHSDVVRALLAFVGQEHARLQTRVVDRAEAVAIPPAAAPARG